MLCLLRAVARDYTGVGIRLVLAADIWLYSERRAARAWVSR